MTVTHDFRGRSFESAKMARDVLNRAAHLLPPSTTTIVCEHDGRFVPVVIHRDNLHFNIRAICELGITVLN